MRKNHIQSGSFLIMISVILTCCEKNNIDSQSDILIFPVGRSALSSGSINTRIGDEAFKADLFYDSCGGYWLQIPKSAISKNENISITITRKKEDINLFSEIAGFNQAWISSSYYIDSDNENITSKAKELTSGFLSSVEKARSIQRFVISHLEMRIYKDSFLEKASTSLELGYGTCINFSRLYVALCRAAKIPSRTIWGVVYGYNNDNVYDYHHQWAEILDESGYWHPSDFNYTTNFDLNDIRYLDLIYSAEENTIIKDRYSYRLMFDNLKFYNNYPVTLSARLGFGLKSDNRPDSMVVEYHYYPRIK